MIPPPPGRGFTSYASTVYGESTPDATDSAPEAGRSCTSMPSGRETLRMNRQLRTVVIAAAVIVVLAGIGYSVYRTRTPPAENRVPPAAREARAEDARDLIARLTKSDQVDYGAAVDKAEQFQRDGKLADAQLLYFFAARGGNAKAAFALAEMNDPNYFKPATSLLDEPAPFQAFKWYTVARDQGMNEASERLEQLHKWAEHAAQAGDEQAQRLLLEWK